MATLIDTLKAQGRATDYNSRKSLYESMGLNKQYGDYQGTASQNINFMNILGGGKPSPGTVSTNSTVNNTSASPNALGTMNLPAGVNLSSLTPIQKQYVGMMSQIPSSQQLYDQYSKELGITDQQNLVTNLSKTVMDLEDKINKVEPAINERAKDFVISEGQRGRMVNAEQLPLREQYLEATRQKNYADAGLSARAELLKTRMGYAQEEYSRPLEILKTVMDLQSSNKKDSSTYDPFTELLKLRGGETNQDRPSLDDLFGGSNTQTEKAPSLEELFSTLVKDSTPKTKEKNTKVKTSKAGTFISKEKIA